MAQRKNKTKTQTFCILHFLFFSLIWCVSDSPAYDYYYNIIWWDESTLSLMLGFLYNWGREFDILSSVSQRHKSKQLNKKEGRKKRKKVVWVPFWNRNQITQSGMRFSVLYKRQKIEPNEAYKKGWTTLFVEQRAKMKGKKWKKNQRKTQKCCIT